MSWTHDGLCPPRALDRTAGLRPGSVFIVSRYASFPFRISAPFATMIKVVCHRWLVKRPK